MDTGSLVDPLIALADRCRAALAAGGDVAATLFVAGLVGGIGHCAGMCGPFVLSQTMARLEGVPAATMSEGDRWWSAVLVPYHLGRATTYAGLGALAGGLASRLSAFAGLGRLSGVLLAAAALAFGLQALRGFGIGLGTAAAPPWLASVERLARPLLARPEGGRGYLLGAVLGFLPCGLLYGALAAAAAAGGAFAGGFAMVAFAAGTAPALVAVGILGQAAAHRARMHAARVAPPLLIVNAGVLGYLAWRQLV